jgi:uncharacterized protein (TIGR00725 family)
MRCFKMIAKIGIAAHSSISSEDHRKKAIEFVDEVYQRSVSEGIEVYLLLGGYWGIMKVAVDEAIRKGLKVILFPPLERESDVDYPKEAILIRTGMSMRGRSIPFVRSSEVLAVLGGSSGTLLEAIVAYAEGIPVFVLSNLGLPTDELKALSPYIDERRSTEIKIFEEPKKMVDGIFEHLRSKKTLA